MSHAHLEKKVLVHLYIQMPYRINTAPMKMYSSAQSTSKETKISTCYTINLVSYEESQQVKHEHGRVWNMNQHQLSFHKMTGASDLKQLFIYFCRFCFYFTELVILIFLLLGTQQPGCHFYGVCSKVYCVAC